MLALFGTPNQQVIWAAAAGKIVPLSDTTDAAGVACAMYYPTATEKMLTEGLGRALMETGGGDFILLESSARP